MEDVTTDDVTVSTKTARYEYGTVADDNSVGAAISSS